MALQNVAIIEIYFEVLAQISAGTNMAEVNKHKYHHNFKFLSFRVDRQKLCRALIEVNYFFSKS